MLADNSMAQKLPSLVIVGRPNVGKSTLFNRLTGTRRSIVTNEPGITRDRIYGRAEWRGRAIEIVDTGGIIPDDKALIPTEIFRQAHVAIEKAALLVLVVDSQAGITPLDQELARLMRNTGKPFVIAVNKVDVPSQESLAGEFHKFGVPVFPIAAEHGAGIDDLLDAALAQMKSGDANEEAAPEVDRVTDSRDDDGFGGHGREARWAVLPVCGYGGNSAQGQDETGGGKIERGDGEARARTRGRGAAGGGRRAGRDAGRCDDSDVCGAVRAKRDCCRE